MNNLWQEIKVKMLHSGSKISLLIGINVIVFLLINIPATFEMLFFRSSHIYEFTDTYLQMPAALSAIGKHFWTPITYMFMHSGVLHILFNMLWLFWLGRILEEFVGNKHTITLYLLGGLVGAVFFVAGLNLLPLFAGENLANYTIVGASAGVMAVVVAAATLVPDYTISLMFIGPVKLKWLILFYVILDFLGTIGPNAGGEMAHLGGTLIGFIYIKQLQRGNDWSKPLNNLFKAQPKLKIVSRGNPAEAARNAPRQEDVDRILDKISQSGFNSLSKQEKETLSRASNNQ